MPLSLRGCSPCTFEAEAVTETVQSVPYVCAGVLERGGTTVRSVACCHAGTAGGIAIHPWQARKHRCTGSDLPAAAFPRPVYCSAEVNSGERKEEEANNKLTHS